MISSNKLTNLTTISNDKKIVKHRFISLKKHAERLKGRQKTEFLCGLVDSSFN